MATGAMLIKDHLCVTLLLRENRSALRFAGLHAYYIVSRQQSCCINAGLTIADSHILSAYDAPR
jgi:hypothetical protein